ncbi:hypothetical protein HYH02_000954 [Chlamydomonas schloesseri]|uniref:Uncharacterized protein n=1 Tax=Chlamydomonas schloesseri TaxID=2026947 RepID=A0A836BE06_9CHLO|nr:hypothetical protein HYH02_000954 [Chlamydomonas schloesseri]|eukprot:KAG2455135.1 hypothetical protein HYH02_000954 [Chlamydomonas schloesseri]
MLEPDRLLWSFRKTAGLPTPGTPYIASWEDPGCELRGHFVGHYLSALSLAWAGTGNSAFKTRLDVMVAELGKVQEALGSGYLSAFPTEFFDRVEALKPVWAPYYTIHKIIAGLVDAHELAGHRAALPMAVRMVAYHWNRTQALIAAKGREHWNGVLNCEFGGMNEILYRMHRLTKDPTHMEFAQLFNKPFFRKPMESGNDMLMNLHANTHLAQVAGFAEEYDTVGTAAARQATSNFFDIVTQHHSFATGGSTDHEFWQAPDELADSVLTHKHGVETQETCTQYNILKIARSLFRWTGDVRYADFYERALVNGILGTARLPPEDWPEHALPKRGRGGRNHHHHHHHHHVNRLRNSLDTATGQQQAQDAASQLALDQLQVGAGASGAVLVSPHRRPHNEEWLNWWAFAKPRPEWNASDAHGPGVFIYLLPLGTGQSKSDNIHHWGFPFHSFWCCYGTVIESYAKLADSIYFKEMSPANTGAFTHDKAAVRLPPRLYVNQLVSSKATWAEMKLRVTMEADMFAPGPAAVAQLTLESTKAPGPGSHDLGSFTLMLRVPEWLAPDRHGGVAEGGSGGSIEVNGQLWTSCPGPVKPGSYCAITRQWASGDGVALRFPMRWRLQALAENRAQYQGLKAVMLGPFVMAGITHNDRGLTLPAAPPGTAAAAAAGTSAGGGGGGAAPPVELRRRVYPPEEPDELMSIQAAWNASLHLRHDSHIAYVSQLEDGGDAMDATFRIGRGCHHGGDSPAGVSGAGGSGHNGLLSLLHGRLGAGGGQSASDDAKSLAEEGAEGSSSHGSLASAFSSLRSMMRLGAHDSGSALSLESMSYPNHYLAHDHTDVIVLQPGAAAGASSAACSRAMWMMRPGLDGAADTVSFEAVGRPGWFVSAASPEQQTADAAACHDAPGDVCHDHGERGPCARDAYVARVLCRQFCGNCNVTGAALRLRQRPSGGPAAGGSFAAASSFKLTVPARRAYPAGSFVLAGLNRHYLVAPIGHLVDERYTAYFMVDTKARGGQGGAGGVGGGGARMGIKRGRRGGEGGGL